LFAVADGRQLRLSVQALRDVRRSLEGGAVSTSSANSVDGRLLLQPAIHAEAAGALALEQVRSVCDELLQALPVAAYTTDARGLITSFNEAAVKLWGSRPEIGNTEYFGSCRLYGADGTALALAECPMAIALREKRPIRGMEGICERPDGTRVAHVQYPTPLFDESGALIGAVNVVVDISERKRATEVYGFTDRLYRARGPKEIHEAALDAITRGLGCSRASILLLDAAGVMRFVAWRGLSDTYRSAVEGHSPWASDVKDAQPICIADIETADFPEPLKAVVKAERIGALAFIPLVANGALIGKFMMYYDAAHVFSEADVTLAVTIARQLGFGIERMRAEQSGRLLASIIATSSDAIVSKDLNGIVTSWNKGAERMFGFAADEMIGRSIKTIIPPDRHGEEVEILGQIRRGEPVRSFWTVRQRKNGDLIDISLTVSPLKDAEGRVVGASKIARDVSDTKQAQARMELLAREIQHRTKNMFAVVLAVVSRSFAGKRTLKDAEAAVMSRLHSLGQTHAMLIGKEWQGADLAEIVRSEMGPFAGRVQVDGPPLTLGAKAAESFALALHELATNAAKYGALSNATGRVHIGWSKAVRDGSERFIFRWREEGGPAVSPPTERGFGSAVLEQVMAEHFDVPPCIDFATEGLRYELHGSLDALR
jgi:PAS domain S-box-containing protein